MHALSNWCPQGSLRSWAPCMNGSVQTEQHLSFGPGAAPLTDDVSARQAASSWVCVGSRARASGVNVSERRGGVAAVWAPRGNILPLSTYAVSPMMMASAMHRPDAKPLVREASVDGAGVSVGGVPGQSDGTEG